LYGRVHPGNHDYVEEASLKTFMDNCNPNEDFRLAVKRTRPKNLHRDDGDGEKSTVSTQTDVGYVHLNYN
jgi:hypothetical protein